VVELDRMQEPEDERGEDRHSSPLG
jgi:hypothetical protein